MAGLAVSGVFGLMAIGKKGDESHVHVGKVLAIEATTEDRDVLLWRTVGETIDNASAQALVVAAETARVATKHD
ncbi:MAG: hypothetical protein U0270_35150 [Labilithrix sp.]